MKLLDRRTVAMLAAFLVQGAFAEGSAIAPRFLWSASDADGAKVVCDAGVSYAKEGGSFAVSFAPGDAAWPGFSVCPKSGTWDLSTWGHVEMTLKNPGSKPLSVGLRVDNNGDWRKNPWNSENVYLKPGETKVGKVIFGYQYGFQKGYKLDSSKVAAVKIFLNGKSAEPRTLVVGDVSAAGAAGEKPPVDPAHVVVKPKGGVIPGAPLKVSVDKQGAAVPLKPQSGYWNLGDWLKVTAVVKNTGNAPVTPKMTIDANGEKISAVSAAAVAPGARGVVEACFIPEKPWHAAGDGKDVKPTGGTKFESHRVKGFWFGAAEAQGAYEVISVKAEKVRAKIPAWLGKRPPVPGNWTQTLAEEFNDGKLDEKVWSPYSANYWDKRTHFTRENILFRDGKCVLRYEKKRGAKNDDPALGETDYACGILDSYGKWTQRYGYFEARMKLPKKPGLWPAFWTMPDRGPSAGPERWMRTDTHKGVRHHGIPHGVGSVPLQRGVPLGRLPEGAPLARHDVRVHAGGRRGLHHGRHAVAPGRLGDLRQRRGARALGVRARRERARAHLLLHGLRRMGQRAARRRRAPGRVPGRLVPRLAARRSEVV